MSISCAVETVAENLVDSVLSPMFYFGLAGVPGAVFLRVSNTEDAMVGYLTDKHRNCRLVLGTTGRLHPLGRG